MRSVIAMLMFGACAQPAVEMKLLVPNETPDFDMSCVTAVDLLPIAIGDTATLDIGGREDGSSDSIPCVDLQNAPKNFAELQSDLTGKFDIALPKSGLAGVEMRGRAGNCAAKPAEYEAVFYGGATYHTGDSEIRIKLARSISCDAKTTFTVHPVDMLALFTTKMCADWTDTTATLEANDVRTTLIDTSPVIVESGLSSKSMSTPTVSVDSWSSAYPGTCAAMELGTATVTGLSCINANGPTACAGANLEVAVVANDFRATADAALVTQFGAANFVGVWSSSSVPAGPVSGATVTLDDGSPKSKIIYGDINGTTFQPSGAPSTTAGGIAVVYTSGVVGITVSAPGKSPRHMYVGASAEIQSAQIAVLN
jgi:hypothetical protein